MSISILPNEVLRAIFSFLPPYDRVKFTDNVGMKHDLSQLLILRSISRRFRILFYDLPFWYDDNSDFSILLHRHFHQSPSVRFFDQLYGDKNLVPCFSHKAGWTFSSLESLVILMAKVTPFHQNARRVILKLEKEKDRDAAIRALAKCRHITELSLMVETERYSPQADCGPFNLSSVARSFPYLESLTLNGIRHSEGSLSNANLKSLVIRMRNWPGGPYVTSSLIPFNSTRSLTKLTLVLYFDIDFRGINPYASLVNLTDLELFPLKRELWKPLVTAKFNLLHFSTEIHTDRPPSEVVSVIFSSPCFQRLQSLTLSHLYMGANSDAYWRYSKEIVIIITHQLRSICSLETYMPLDTSWCSSFEHLCNLKTLRWSIQMDYRARHFLAPVKGNNWEESRANAVKEFQRIFANFEQKPRVIIDDESGWAREY